MYQQYQALQAELADVRTLAESADGDIRELADEEIYELNSKLSDHELQMLWRLEPDSRDDVVVTIELNTYGVKRQHELYDILLKLLTSYLVSQNLNLRFSESGYCYDSTNTEVFYLKEAEPYRKLAYENGIHQFIYLDEVGKQQTFDVFVEVTLLIPYENVVQYTADFEVKKFDCLGAGGMSVTRRQRSRVIHRSTGLSASITGGYGLVRHWYERRILASKVHHYEQDPIMLANRHKVIRSYDTINNIVVDYRLPEIVFNLKDIQVNGLGQIIHCLIEQDKLRLMKDYD